jgi:hypothetical protein
MLALVFLSSFIAYNPKSPIAFALGVLTHKDPFLNADQARRPDTLFGAEPETRLRSYLSLPENSQGAVETCSFDPFVRYHLNRRPAGPYITFHAIAFRLNPGSQPPKFADYQLRWQQAYMDSLHTVKPKFIIMARNMPFWYIHDVYNDCLHYLPGFDSLMTASYRYDTAFGGYQVYRRITN